MPNVWKYQSKGDITGWGNRPLRVIGWCSSGRYACFLLVCDSSRLCLENSNRWQREDLGLHLEKRKSRRVSPEVITDFDFADDIALLSEEIQQAQELLSRVEMSVGKVGLRMNASKTKCMCHSIKMEISTYKQMAVPSLRMSPTLNILGPCPDESSEKDVKVRKAAAWRACSKLNKIWKSALPRGFKQRLFAATVESVLLYGCEAWTVTPKLSKDLDGCYTRLLRTVFNRLIDSLILVLCSDKIVTAILV